MPYLENGTYHSPQVARNSYSAYLNVKRMRRVDLSSLMLRKKRPTGYRISKSILHCVF
jgi:hypothetical protein